MSNSDLTLENNGLARIEGDVFKVEAFEIQLDNTDRRSQGNNDFPRRALVHDFSDGLTLNWDHDYPGGVTVNGPLVLPDGISGANKDGGALKIGAIEIQLDNAGRRSRLYPNKPRRALVHDFSDGLTLNWDRDYPGGITLRGRTIIEGPLVVCRYLWGPLPHHPRPNYEQLAADKFGGNASDYEVFDVSREFGSLQYEVNLLKDQVALLREQVAALNAKLGT
ncbi:hypothetical protein [Sorangium sp. So ce145]|uniref:hypothetical protein n=1 Tax=Sorangium sp. So ce145 TaxID=3133285 RepID=UPI003F64918B